MVGTLDWKYLPRILGWRSSWARLNQPVYSNNGNDYADPTIVYNSANGYYYMAATQGPDGTHIRVYKANTLGVASHLSHFGSIQNAWRFC